jgi:hypothetical protein
MDRAWFRANHRLAGVIPITIVLDLVDPCRPTGRDLGGAGQAGIFAPGTNVAVHRGDQRGGQGSAAIPSYPVRPFGSRAWPE